jgi:hypothetical protein
MRLRYLHLHNYPPIQDMAVRFASGSPLNRECAIRFVVGVNGSGKSNLLRAVAEVFLALADERLPPFPVSLIYELGRRDTREHRTLLVDCPGGKAEASLWISEGFHWPDATPADRFENAIEVMRANTGPGPDGFAALIPRGSWPQTVPIAYPKAVLAYTTGDLRPWRSIWNRDQSAEGLQTRPDEDGEDSFDERPAGWTPAQEAALALPQLGETSARTDGESGAMPAPDTPLYRRPILLNPTLLKCALLAVALPQAFFETADYPARKELDSAMARFRHRADNKNALQELLERGGWHHLVSVAFRCRLQARDWNRNTRETAHDWLLCASEVIAEPHPTEARRVLFFDLKAPFSGQDASTLSANAGLSICTTQGEALWTLLGGHEVTSFELFTRLMELHQTGLFDDLELRLRRDHKPDSGACPEEQERDIGILRYEELSDGEQMVLGRMALFHLLAGQEDALLLLDEPETHFNDKWKREIIDIIDDAIGHTANDVLISTHSAIVLSDVFNDEIVMVVKTADGSGVRSVDQQTFATDPSALMMTVFEADDSIGKRAQEFIQRKLDQATGSAGDIQQLEQLIARMGSGFYRSELRTLLNTWRDARPDEPYLTL